MIGLLAAGLLAAGIGAPLLAEARRSPMSDELRKKAPGALADLPQGRTHFEWVGPDRGPVAVCIHGLTTPSYVFAGTRQTLADLGFRVLTYDLFGRGYSDRPTGAQSSLFFVRQLEGLLRDQEVRAPHVVLGFSMGAAIATRYAADNPDRIRALVLMAPAGVAQVYDSASETILTAPLIGDWHARVLGGRALRRELSQDVEAATVIPDLVDRQIAETRVRGFLPAVLSSKRHCLRESYASDHRLLGEAGVPTLAIWGSADPVIPISTLGALADLNPSAHHVQIEGAGHGLPQTHPVQVAHALKDFLAPLNP